MLSNTPIENKADIFAFFEASAVPRNELKIGIEVERSGIYIKTLKPVGYDDKHGYHAVLKRLVGEAGWKVTEQDEVGNIFALRRGESEIHTEMDGRLELASRPRKRLKSLVRDFIMYEQEIDVISRDFGIQWVSTGMQPFAKLSEIPWLKKTRAQKLRTFFQKNGVSADTWLKKTNSVHVNFGYTSENDAIAKFQTLFTVTPILAAMFANSPLNNGKFSGFMTSRLADTQNFFPERNRLREHFLKEDFDFTKWIDFVCSLPMIYIERKDKIIPMMGKTFADFLQNGHRRHRAKIKDFALHIKSCWTEIKLKEWLELRTIDCVPPHLLPSIPVLIRGLTLNADTMQATRKLMKKYSFAEHCEITNEANKKALAAVLPDGTKMLDLAKELLEIANYTLKKAQKKPGTRYDSSRFLWPIKKYVFVREQSPAEFVMEMWNGKWHRDPRKLLEWSGS